MQGSARLTSRGVPDGRVGVREEEDFEVIGEGVAHEHFALQQPRHRRLDRLIWSGYPFIHSSIHSFIHSVVQPFIHSGSRRSGKRRAATSDRSWWVGDERGFVRFGVVVAYEKVRKWQEVRGPDARCDKTIATMHNSTT